MKRNPQNPTVVHLISHNHWDREWIFQAEYVNQWLPPFFEHLFEMLQTQPDYLFVLDGQTCIIEDYLNQLSEEEAAEKAQKIKEYAQAGRLMVGSAYIQQDWGLVSGEALVRNFLTGIRMANELGGVMRVGWLLDNFGQIAQAPQICCGFDIDGVFVWRGPELPPESIRTEFQWQAPDGSKVLAVYLLNSYRNAMVLATSHEIAKERILAEVRVLRTLATTPNVLLMNGYEQVPWPDNILPIIDEVNYEFGKDIHCVQSTPPKYLHAIKSYDPDLPILSGYLYSGKYMPILKGVFSSRIPLKLRNQACQMALERWAEPFAAFAYLLGHDYPADALQAIWKTLLQNQAHDDICGCCIDPIAVDMEERFAQVYKQADEIVTEGLKSIAGCVNATTENAEAAMLVFNPADRPRREVVGFTMRVPKDAQACCFADNAGNPAPHQMKERSDASGHVYLLCDVPALGYKTYYLVRGQQQVGAPPAVTYSEKERVLENEYLRVAVRDNGTLSLTDKRTGQVYDDLSYFEDGGDAGDTYDYSFPEKDRVINSMQEQAEITLEEAGPLMARIKVELALTLPIGLRANRKQRHKQTRRVPVVSYISLTAKSPQVEVTTIVKNVVKDHRLRVCFPTATETDHAIAEEPFDLARLSLAPETVPKELPEKLRPLMLAGRYTVPINTRVFQNSVGLRDVRRGVTILTSGLSEFEVLPEKNTLALTLLRSVGWLARQDLLTREGDVGPHIFTPQAQCLGEHVFSYAVYPHSATAESANFRSESQNLKMRVVRTQPHAGALPDTHSFVYWMNQNPKDAFKLTCVKLSEDQKGLILRFYNTTEHEAMGKLKLWDEVNSVWKTNLNEDILTELTFRDGSIKVSARPKEIVTLKLMGGRMKRKFDQRYQEYEIMSVPPLKPAFPQVDMPPVITEPELQAEAKREKGLEQALQKALERVRILEGEIGELSTKDQKKMAELQQCKTEYEALRRYHYESRISWLLNTQLLTGKSVAEELQAMGEPYCVSRTMKRVSEYLSHFYEKLLCDEES